MTRSDLTQIEGEPFTVDAQMRDSLNTAMTRLKIELRFRTWPLADYPGGKIAIRGVIGTISLRDGRTINIVPKTDPTDDWIKAILNLVMTSDRIDAAGKGWLGLDPTDEAFCRSLLPYMRHVWRGHFGLTAQ
jgi:hypothetical protein